MNTRARARRLATKLNDPRWCGQYPAWWLNEIESALLLARAEGSEIGCKLSFDDRAALRRRYRAEARRIRKNTASASAGDNTKGDR